jgi:hypothetical protein
VDEEDFGMEEEMVIGVGDGYPRRVRAVIDVVPCVYVNRSSSSRGH